MARHPTQQGVKEHTSSGVYRRRLTLSGLGNQGVLVLYAAVTLLPMLWLISSSLKPSREVFMEPFASPAVDSLAWDNYYRAWTLGRFGAYFGNSLFVTVSTVALTLAFASLAAYALSRFTFRGRRMLYALFLAGLMVPIQLTVVPLFFELKLFGLLNSRVGLVLVYVATGLPFAVFVLTGFFRSLPTTMRESALLDGCGELRAFWHVMLPLARPGLAATGIFLVIGTWNEYFLAFMFLSGEGAETRRTLPLGVAYVTTIGEYHTDWGVTFAGLVIMMLPTLVLYLFTQKWLIQGINTGGLKG